MKKTHRNIIGIVLFCLCVFLLPACGSEKQADPDVTTFRLNADGTVTQTIIGEADLGASDLQGYMNELIAAYNTNEEPQVTLTDYVLDGNGKNVKITLTYSSIEDYAAFNQVDAYIGTVESAYSAGYKFGKKFVTGQGIGISGSSLAAEYPSFSVIVLKEAMDVIIPEKALLVSDDITINANGSLTIAKSVTQPIPEVFQSVNSDCSYIIFKQPESEKKS